MITEIIEYIKGICEANGIDKAYTGNIQHELLTNVCAVRPISDAEREYGVGNCGRQYTEQTFAILYRGSQSRMTSLEIIEAVEKVLDATYGVTLTNTWITSILSAGVTYAFTDDKKYVHYSVMLRIQYNEN